MAGEQKGKTHYKSLLKLLPMTVWDTFNFANYVEDETRVLKPALERMGHSNIVFAMGEKDSWGPLSRTVTFTDRQGKTHYYVYG